MTYKFIYPSPIGRLQIVCNDTHLVELHIDTAPEPATLETSHSDKPATDICHEVCRWLDSYFAGDNPSATPPTAPTGSEFQLKVWRELLKIPYGTTTTYGTIARTLAQHSGRQVSAQAVGGAVGRNPIAIVIPCHRVIGADGNLTGFASGIDAKIKLLINEHITIDNLTLPRRR